GRGLGFPFDLAWLDLSARCLHLLAALRTFLRTPPADAQVLKALETLDRMLRPLEKDQPPFLLLLEALSKRADLFHRLRAVLRLEEKNPTAKKLHQIRAALQGLKASLRRKRPERGRAKDTREAIDLILEHLDRHGPYLWGHALRLPRRVGGGRRRDSPSGPHEQWLGVSLPHHQTRRTSPQRSQNPDSGFRNPSPCGRPGNQSPPCRLREPPVWFAGPAARSFRCTGRPASVSFDRCR